MRSDLPVTELAENVYLLNEFDGTNCYLVVGSEKALLIDCGTGFCDIRGAAEKLTDLPITLAATHGHGDHIGGAGQFEEIYIHRADCERLNKAQMSLLFRKAFLASNAPVKSHGFKTSDVKPGKYKTKIIPMDDGHIFDLGGKSVRVKHTPGHSHGSVAFIDEQDKIIFSGDNVCDALWMQLPGVTSIEEWLHRSGHSLGRGNTGKKSGQHKAAEDNTVSEQTRRNNLPHRQSIQEMRVKI